jgi:hypothetical protein
MSMANSVDLASLARARRSLPASADTLPSGGGSTSGRTPIAARARGFLVRCHRPGREMPTPRPPGHPPGIMWCPGCRGGGVDIASRPRAGSLRHSVPGALPPPIRSRRVLGALGRACGCNGCIVGPGEKFDLGDKLRPYPGTRLGINGDPGWRAAAAPRGHRPNLWSRSIPVLEPFLPPSRRCKGNITGTLGP